MIADSIPLCLGGQFDVKSESRYSSNVDS